MRFLPIVERELREGSRRPATYWRRVWVAFQAILIGVVAYLLSFFDPHTKLGQVLFWGLSGMSMLFCLFAGRGLTADCLSKEKREGTLGLLFLTDLKGYDVVMGKLTATSLAGFYALLTVFPVLAIPMLAGGMTNGELWRMVLVLANTFFLSLAIGILASAMTWEYRTAMAANFFLFALVIGGLPACGFAVDAATGLFVPPFFYLCPLYSFVLCQDKNYAGSSTGFWCSVGLTHLLAWLFVILACSIVPRAWGDKPAVAASGRWRWRELGALVNYGGPTQRAAFRKKALDENAFFWLTARAWLKPVHVWIFVGVAALWWIYGWLKARQFWLVEGEVYITTAVLLNCSFKAWIALEAGHQSGEDRRSNAFELLLVTPMTVDDILGGQWRAMRRQFLWPLLLVVAVELIFAAVMYNVARRRDDAYVLLAVAVMLVADVTALVWVAMLTALTSRSQTRATLAAVFRIIGVPWMAFAGVFAAWQAAYFMDWIRQPASDSFELCVWLCAGFLADLIFGLHAWKSLRRNFREIALRPLVRERTHFHLRQFLGDAVAAVGRLAARIVAPRWRMPVAVGLIAALALAAVALVRARPKAPPPVVVSIKQVKVGMGIFPCGRGVLMVLPDGTLWKWGRSARTLAVVPEQVGEARDWVKAIGNARYSLGLRANGTIWTLGYANAYFDTKPPVDGSDWRDIGVGEGWALVLRKDGTIWGSEWGFTATSRQWNQVETESNWTAVSCRDGGVFGLRSDGTLWTWGQLYCSRDGSYWVSTNISSPTRVCAETNWIGLDDGGLVRNRAGETWQAATALPDAQASASIVCTLVNSNGVGNHIHALSYRAKAEIRSDGTLWTGHAPWAGMPPSNLQWRQIGSRRDWTDVWNIGGTWFGLTADGTLWVWGVDLGAERAPSFTERLEMLKERIAGTRAGRGVPGPPVLKEPRPLLRLAQ
jgi:ABC-type transport system involved in multi-copper enzyme maturation permease subunit